MAGAGQGGRSRERVAGAGKGGLSPAWYGRRLPFLLKKPFLVDSSERGMGKASRLPKNPKAQESER